MSKPQTRLGTPQKYYRDRYLRNLPTSFCAGCGNGTILNSFVRAVDELVTAKELRQRELLAVSGIGCSAWIPSPHFRADTLHTTHGRAIAFATGAKVMNPKLKVTVFTGDGDGAAIGGNHLIHAARRNIPMTVILVNNFNYGMTGGQSAPTTPLHVRTSTYPKHPEAPFDLCQLMLGAGASYVARWTTFYVNELISTLKETILHPGFAFVEILAQCPTYAARFFTEYQNSLSSDELEQFQQYPGAWMLKAFKGKKTGESNGHPRYKMVFKDREIELGVFLREQRPTLIDNLQELWG
ncbi:MAG: thiamine pyrophosphate-dependent enzyme [Candidatus Hermodarchaeota archaeon]|jgi:2-oxoglutarate ferredoxin oxidoreductase subunit beta|nr:thiamine pyrophosphate-dependent enzyme [Candidatus Hermodarchaeota archaeon]